MAKAHELKISKPVKRKTEAPMNNAASTIVTTIVTIETITALNELSLEAIAPERLPTIAAAKHAGINIKDTLSNCI